MIYRLSCDINACVSGMEKDVMQRGKCCSTPLFAITFMEKPKTIIRIPSTTCRWKTHVQLKLQGTTILSWVIGDY